jgi:hypothetical protein
MLVFHLGLSKFQKILKSSKQNNKTMVINNFNLIEDFSYQIFESAITSKI